MKPPIQPAALASAETFLVRAAELLHVRGTPAHRLEALLSSMATSLGAVVQVLSTPTSLFVAFGDRPAQRTHLLRVGQGAADLGGVVEIDELLERLEHGEIPLDDAQSELERIAVAPGRHGTVLSTAAHAGVAAGAAVLFGGGLADVVGAGLLGVVLGLLVPAIATRSQGAALTELLAAFVASAIATAAAVVEPTLSAGIVTLSSLIVLIPGLSVTVGMIDLATRHMVSGAARLADAATVFLMIGLGAALGRTVVDACVDGPLGLGVAAAPLPVWAHALAYAVSPLAFLVLFQARWRETPWIVAAAWAGVAAAWCGGGAFGAEVGAFCGAAAVGLVANAFARLRDRPASVPLLPGILMLVPGSIGYRALALFMGDDTVAAVDAVFQAVITATALAGGLLVAGALLSPRRTL